MNRWDNLFRGAIIAALLCALGNLAILRADTGGGWAGAVRAAVGEFGAARSVNLSSTTGTAIWSASKVRPNGVCINNSAFVVWIGTDNGTYNNVPHPNITNGFPVLASSTFRLDGSFTGEIDATADTAAGGSTTVNVRCFDGQVQ